MLHYSDVFEAVKNSGRFYDLSKYAGITFYQFSNSQELTVLESFEALNLRT